MKSFFQTALLLFSTVAAAASNGSGAKQSIARTINDSWYTIQAGSTPYGYFHERIEEKDGKYHYRYALTKLERGKIYEENIGAVADADLRTVAFNLNKNGNGTIESVDASFSIEGENGVFTMSVQGAKRTSYKRRTQKDVILDVFFPVWLRNHPDLLAPGKKGRVMTFAEDPAQNTFLPKPVRFETLGNDNERQCVKLKVDIEGKTQADWCMTREGILVSLSINQYRVKRAKSEQEAKNSLAGVTRKK